MPEQFTISWHDGRREAKCPPDPEFPNGKHIALDVVAKCCRVELPYPAPRCGVYVVKCTRCGVAVAITTAGRIDDPISADIMCATRRIRH